MKKIIALAVVTSALTFAGKNVIPAPSEPVAVTPPPAMEDKLTSHGIGLKIGTLGVGVDIEHYFSKKHALRFNPNYFKYTKDNKEIGDVSYDAKLTLKNVGLLYDYHPWESSFRISLGAYYNGNKLTGTARPSGSVTFGGKTYNPGEIGRVEAKVDFKKVAPYLGIGWSSPDKEGWHFIGDIGVMYVGSPKIWTKAYASKTLPNYNQIQADLDNRVETEKQKIYNDVKKYKWWPVISIGIQKKF